MTNAILIFIYAMIAAGTALVLNMLGIAAPAEAGAIGAIAFLFLSQIQGAVARRREKRQTRHEIAQLKQAAKEFGVALSETHAKIEQVKSAIEAKSSAQSRKIVS